MRGGWSTRKNRTQGQLAAGGLPCSPKARIGEGKSDRFRSFVSIHFNSRVWSSSLCFFPISAAAARRVQTENQICTEITRLVTNKYACPTVFCLGGGDDATWTCGRDCSRLHESRRRLVIGLHDTSVMGRPAQLSIQRTRGISDGGCHMQRASRARSCDLPEAPRKGGPQLCAVAHLGTSDLNRSGRVVSLTIVIYPDFDVLNGQMPVIVCLREWEKAVVWRTNPAHRLLNL